MKRLLDMVVSFFGLLLLSHVLAAAMFLIWKQDRRKAETDLPKG
jgi:lipopolysaccharide/colanic/teichoic acid biosynthesis glycosyltransferase